MGFLIHTVEGGYVPPFLYKPAGAITPKIGMALVESGGNLVAATGTTKPTHICMIEGSTALSAGTLIPVIAVNPGIVFETTCSAAFTNIKKGDKVTLHTDGMQVTATKTNGVATVVDGDGGASGSKVRVRFAPETTST